MQTSTTAALGALAAAVGFRIYRYATRAESPAEEVAAKAAAKPTLYEQQEAELQHFSGLLFGGSLTNTCIEWGARAAIIALGVANPGGLFTPRSGCQGLVEVGLWMCAMSVFNRGYNSFLEYAYARNPQYRTQPPLEHALRQECDLVGRELSDLKAQDLHDRMTLILDALTTTALMAINPGFFPGRGGVQHGVVERGVRLLLHQYTIAFTMYWAHRAGHVTPFKWHNIHGAHHQVRSTNLHFTVIRNQLSLL
ncbi:hypothetical protein T492DRAFT_188971 [Pavlovales sp. CCMP2436]|nr:hypothetical protein T492DRAFT_188971 [Pavlovales sp. CCMP2436]